MKIIQELKKQQFRKTINSIKVEAANKMYRLYHMLKYINRGNGIHNINIFCCQRCFKDHKQNYSKESYCIKMCDLFRENRDNQVFNRSSRFPVLNPFIKRTIVIYFYDFLYSRQGYFNISPLLTPVCRSSAFLISNMFPLLFFLQSMFLYLDIFYIGPCSFSYLFLFLSFLSFNDHLCSCACHNISFETSNQFRSVHISGIYTLVQSHE